MRKLISGSWKIGTILLLMYTIIGGLLFEVPRKNILNETIRLLYFHVPMWFGMIILLTISVFFSIKYLANRQKKFDCLAIEFANIGITFGILGITTGMIWATYTWGAPWHGDPKENATAISLLIYTAYFILRKSIDDKEQQAKISAIYNIFAFATLIPLLFVLPRLTDSLHPGNGGNPGFNSYDLDDRMRLVFYPAVIGWTSLGIWLALLNTKINLLNQNEK